MNELGWNEEINNWIYETEVDTSNSFGLIYYHFRINYYGRNIIYGNNTVSYTHLEKKGCKIYNLGSKSKKNVCSRRLF